MASADPKSESTSPSPRSSSHPKSGRALQTKTPESPEPPRRRLTIIYSIHQTSRKRNRGRGNSTVLGTLLRMLRMTIMGKWMSTSFLTRSRLGFGFGSIVCCRSWARPSIIWEMLRISRSIMGRIRLSIKRLILRHSSQYRRRNFSRTLGCFVRRQILCRYRRVLGIQYRKRGLSHRRHLRSKQVKIRYRKFCLRRIWILKCRKITCQLFGRIGTRLSAVLSMKPRCPIYWSWSPNLRNQWTIRWWIIQALRFRVTGNSQTWTNLTSPNRIFKRQVWPSRWMPIYQ